MLKDNLAEYHLPNGPSKVPSFGHREMKGYQISRPTSNDEGDGHDHNVGPPIWLPSLGTQNGSV